MTSQNQFHLSQDQWKWLIQNCNGKIQKGINMVTLTPKEVEKALDFLFDFDTYSEYNKQLNIVYDYILKLEEQIINES